VNRSPALSLGQVLRVALRGGKLKLPRRHWNILNLLAACRTPALGGHRYHCGHCGKEHFAPHACGNRHCPQCQGAQAFDWLERQQAALLPIPYFHVVFTLPHRLNPLIRQNRKVMFNLLFESVSQTLLLFGRNELQAQMGLTIVLHTWGQTLGEHYHLHCIVTGGGLALDGSGWVKTSAHYLFPVRALSAVFGGKFRAGLQRLQREKKLEFHGKVKALEQPARFGKLLHKLKTQKFVVSAKRPFAGPEAALKYLSRYTHRVAIGNRRLLGLDERSVTFRYKDYADESRSKTMTLTIEEFTRRFCLHLLPERFVKIRHYGLLGNRDREKRIEQARQSLGVRPREEPEPAQETLLNPPPSTRDATERLRCPHCGALALIWVGEEPRRLRWIKPVLICDTS
jgi:DNA-directed RNA polymerase subunit RPC12/RpoP